MHQEDHQARSAELMAAHHRQKAGEYFAEHRRQRSPSFLTRAEGEMAKAAEYEQKAQALRGQGRRDNTKGVAKVEAAKVATKVANVAANREKPDHQRDHQRGNQQGRPAQSTTHGESEKATQERARRWFVPGSVAQDFQTQLSEANQGGGILAQAASYAARSTFDQEHRTFQNPKKVMGAVGAVGKDVLNAARQYQVQAASRQAERGKADRGRAGRAEVDQQRGASQAQAKEKAPQQKAPQQKPRGKGHER